MPPRMTTRSASRQSCRIHDEGEWWWSSWYEVVDWRRYGDRSKEGMRSRRGKWVVEVAYRWFSVVREWWCWRMSPKFSTIIAQQLQNLLPTIVAQVGGQGGGKGNGRNQNGDSVNDNIRGDVGNVLENNDRICCTYKEFLACNQKSMNGKEVP
ncbi:hypothetical protein Tco_0511215 [Tanacetum coccineum]